MIIKEFLKNTFVDYPEEIASIIFTGGCNFACPYCHNSELIPANTKNLIKEKDIFDFFEKRKGLVDAIVISGGEPSLQPDLYNFIKKIKNLKIKVKIDTNGSDSSLIQKLINDNLIDYIALDYKAPLRLYNTLIPASNVNLEEITKTYNILLSSNIDYEIRTTITKSLLSVEDIIELANEIKYAKSYFLQAFRNSDTVINKELSAYTEEELHYILRTVQAIIPNTKLRI